MIWTTLCVSLSHILLLDQVSFHWGCGPNNLVLLVVAMNGREELL